MATIGFTEPVKVIGNDGIVNDIAKADTGAKRTSIDRTLAETIDASPVIETTTVRSSNGKQERPIVPVGIQVCGENYILEVSVTDRSHMDYPVIIGRDILQNFVVDVNKEAQIAVSDSS